MTKLVLVALLFAVPLLASVYPSIILKNQYGEQANDLIVGGSGEVSCTFKVDPSNPNGLGVSALSSTASAISNVYMNSTATTANVIAAGNPNPSPGYIVVQFNKGFSGYLAGSYFTDSPVTGAVTNVSAPLSQGKPYQIASLGTTTPAQWTQLGVPSGTVPTVSQAFIALGGAGVGGNGSVYQPAGAGSTIANVELIGAPSSGLNSTAGVGVQGQIILQTMAATNSSTTTLTATAPASGSFINLQLELTPQVGSPL